MGLERDRFFSCPGGYGYYFSRVSVHPRRRIVMASIRPPVHVRVKGWRRKMQLPGRPDLVFPKQRVAVFLDGCFWHGCPSCYAAPKSNKQYWIPKIARNIARGKRISSELRTAGWFVLRIWEHQIQKSPAAAVEKLQLRLNQTTV